MLPVFDALFDLEDSQLSFHYMYEMDKCFIALESKDPLDLAISIPQGVTFGDMYTSGPVVVSKIIGRLPLARKCLIH
jgi:hypothetical protein